MSLQLKEEKRGTSVIVQWLRLHAPNAGAPGLIPGQGTRSCMLQLKNLCATIKTWCSQINKQFKKKKKEEKREKGTRKEQLIE